MSHLARLLLVCCILVPSVRAQVALGDADEAVAQAPAAMTSITPEGLRAHLSVLASDGFQGRLTGTLAQHATAHYIAAHFQACGLEPLGDETEGGRRGWFQRYDVTMAELGPGTGLFDAEGRAVVSGGAWVGLGDEIEVRGPLAWVGRDGRGGEIEGAIPVTAMPPFGSESRSLMGDLFRALTRVQALARRAERRGAPALVVVTPKWSVPLVNALNMMGVTELRPQVQLGVVERMGGGRRGGGLPVLFVGGEAADLLVGALGVEWDAVLEGDDEIRARSEGIYLLKGSLRMRPTEATNVVGLLRGRDPELSPQAVIYSCHMDHIGMGADGRPFNGADDNGSGTSTVLEMARAYASLKGEERPRRSVIFLAVSGEELGLWGSDHYAANPTWPLDRLVANINMDMIGRSTEKVPSDAISLTPTYRLGAYSTLAREAAWLGGSKAFGLRMDNGDRFYKRSDHYNFAVRGVPVVFFCDDEHPDYHMQSDDVEKIEFEKLARVARLAFLLGWRTANRDGRPSELGQRADWFEDR